MIKQDMTETIFTRYGKKNLVGKPRYLKSKIPKGDGFVQIKSSLREKNLFTVCEEAKCPNLAECWAQKTATMMILGDTCTRACKFCNVKTGNPKGWLDLEEPKKASEMVELMSLNYLVVTSVDRDDLPDYGASHFAAVVERIHQDHPEVKVEVLIPDFHAEEAHMRALADSKPFVIAQNLETVKRLTHPVRDRRASYEKTLNALEFYSNNYADIATKSSLMVGLGEELSELEQSMKDLRSSGVKIITFGQYLRPTLRHLEVQRYYKEDEFDHLKEIAYSVGFDFVASGPMVRSSYKAAEYLQFINSKK